MVVSVVVVFGLPFLLRLFPTYSRQGFIQGFSSFLEGPTVRIIFGLLLQAGLLLYSFSSEKSETNRTNRMRLRAVAFVVVVLGLAYMVLNVLPFSVQKNILFNMLSFGHEFGYSGIVLFSALILYNIVFKVLYISVLD